MEGQIKFKVWAAGNPDPRNPPVEMGSYIHGKLVEDEDYLVTSRFRERSFPCRVDCPKFSLLIDAVLSDVIYFKKHMGLGKVHFAMAEPLPMELIEFVEKHPKSLEMTFIYDHDAHARPAMVKNRQGELVPYRSPDQGGGHSKTESS